MGINRRALLPIEETKRKRISFTGVSRLSLIITTFQRLCANCVQGVLVCKKKAATRLLVTAWFSLFYASWTSLGLNQGPPDYESVALTNWATSPVLSSSDSGHKNSIFSWNMQTFRVKYTVCCFVFRTYTYVWGSWGTILSLRGLPVQRLLWSSRTRKKQIHLRGKQSGYFLHKVKQRHLRCPVQEKSTSTWYPNSTRPLLPQGETTRW